MIKTIQEMGLELQIVFNKGAVMVLPAGVNKASGFAAALEVLGMSAHNVAAIGDAENDHAFLQASGLSVAVANALPAVKDTADLVTERERPSRSATPRRRRRRLILELLAEPRQNVVVNTFALKLDQRPVAAFPADFGDRAAAFEIVEAGDEIDFEIFASL